MSWSVIVTIAVCTLVLAAGVTLAVRQSRRNRRRIRHWADENGYAVLRLEYRRSGVVMVACLLAGLPSVVLLMFRVVLGAWGVGHDGGRRSTLQSIRNLLLDLPPGAYILAGLTAGLLVVLWVLMGTWKIAIQDEEGGQRDGFVTFGHWLVDLPWGKMNVEWR